MQKTARLKRFRVRKPAAERKTTSLLLRLSEPELETVNVGYLLSDGKDSRTQYIINLIIADAERLLDLAARELLASNGAQVTAENENSSETKKKLSEAKEKIRRENLATLLDDEAEKEEQEQSSPG